MQKVNISKAHVVTYSYTVWVATCVLCGRTCAILVKVQTGGKLGEDGHGDQISKQGSVRSDHGRVCTNSGGRGGCHSKVVTAHMLFWGGCLE